MVSKIFIFALLILSFNGFAAAQSGRRVRSATPMPTSTPQVQQTQDNVEDSSDAAGYSESAPNSPRSISVNRRTPTVAKKEKKDKKESKKQQTKTVDTPAPPTVAAGEDSEDEVVKVETNLVTIPVSVFDRNGLYISNLSKSDFKVFEDGAEQEVAYFGTSENPFTVILLIDVSPSTAYKINEIQDAAVAFVDQLKPQDKVMVIEFDERVSVLTEATGDRQKIYKAIRRADFGSGTSLYEAVDFSLRQRLAKIDGRKAVVLFTDGVDTTSNRADFQSTISDAEESDSMIFPIYYNTFLNNLGIGTGGVMTTTPTLGIPQMGGRNNGTSSAEHTRGRAYLNQLASATGGRVFRPESTPGGLTAAFEGIAEELRRQYSVGYYPANEGTIGQRKQIKVRVNRPKLVIRARDSYIVGGEREAAAK